MQKFTRAASIIAAVLSGLSLMLLVCTMPFQAILSRAAGYPADIVAVLPIFPWKIFLITLLQFGCILPMAVTNTKKGGIWLELLLFLLLSVVIAGFSFFLNQIPPVFASKFGEHYMIADNAVSALATYCRIPGNFAMAIAYTVCGMRLATKVLRNKAAKEV